MRTVLIVLLTCLSCLPAGADVVGELLKAINGGEEQQIQKAMEALHQAQPLPEQSIANALNQIRGNRAKVKDDEKRQKLDQAAAMLTELAGRRGSLKLVSSLIALLDGDNPDVNKQIEANLSRLTCHGIEKLPRMPSRLAKASDWAKRQYAWAKWWKRFSKNRQLFTKPSQLSPFYVYQLGRNGVKIPDFAKLKAKQLDSVIQPLLAGCHHKKFYVRFRCIDMLLFLTGKDLPLDDMEEDQGKRQGAIDQFKQAYGQEKEQIQQHFGQLLEELRTRK